LVEDIEMNIGLVVVVDREKHIVVVVVKVLVVVASSYEVDFAIEVAYDNLVEDDDTLVVEVRNCCTSFVVVVEVVASFVADLRPNFEYYSLSLMLMVKQMKLMESKMTV